MSGVDEDFLGLIRRVREGCPDAARELFERYGGHIRHAVRRRLHERMRARYDSLDFTQDVWASFFTSPLDKYTFDTPESLIAFLTEVAQSKVAKAFRGDFQTNKRNLHVEQPLESVRPDAPPCDPPTPGPTPSQVAIANEHWEQMLGGLSKRYRLMMELLRQGHNRKEVAERTGLNPKLIQRLLNKLAQRRDLT
jgi:RNA polymerase sigma factor (sigma-70 family)